MNTAEKVRGSRIRISSVSCSRCTQEKYGCFALLPLLPLCVLCQPMEIAHLDLILEYMKPLILRSCGTSCNYLRMPQPQYAHSQDLKLENVSLQGWLQQRLLWHADHVALVRKLPLRTASSPRRPAETFGWCQAVWAN